MDYLYDTPWWLLVLLAGTGLLFAWGGYGRRDRTMIAIGGVLLAGTVALFLASRFIETDEEQVVRRSHELVAAVEGRNWSTLEDLMTPDATASAMGREYKSRDDILSDAKAALARASDLKLSPQRVEPRREMSDQYAVELSIYVTGNQYTQLMAWRFRWRKIGGEWKATSLELIRMGVGTGQN